MPAPCAHMGGRAALLALALSHRRFFCRGYFLQATNKFLHYTASELGGCMRPPCMQARMACAARGPHVALLLVAFLPLHRPVPLSRLHRMLKHCTLCSKCPSTAAPQPLPLDRPCSHARQPARQHPGARGALVPGGPQQ